MTMLVNVTFIVLSYLIGSLASAILVCRLMGKDDPRGEGSGNPGATNVLRLHGKKAAAFTLLGDALKGFLPVFAAGLIGLDDSLIAASALAAFLGHLFPLFFQFKGGKGVATFVGILFALHWALGVSFTLIWLSMAALFRYSSLAALLAAVMTPVITIWLYPSFFVITVNSIMSILLLWRHQSNIKNLLSGKENKIGSRET